MKDFCEGCVWTECKETLIYCEDMRKLDHKECERYLSIDNEKYGITTYEPCEE